MESQRRGRLLGQLAPAPDFAEVLVEDLAEDLVEDLVEGLVEVLSFLPFTTSFGTILLGLCLGLGTRGRFRRSRGL